MLQDKTPENVEHYLTIPEYNQIVREYVLENTREAQIICYCLLTASTPLIVNAVNKHFDVSVFEEALLKRFELLESFIENLCFEYNNLKRFNTTEVDFTNNASVKLQFLVMALGKEPVLEVINNHEEEPDHTLKSMNMSKTLHAKLVQLVESIDLR
jgi:hypothetical protein